MRQLMWMSLVLSGCNWLFEVPENRVPQQAQSGEANTRANEVESNGLQIDDSRRPMMKELNMVGDGKDEATARGQANAGANSPEPADDWQPVSIPQDVAPRSFKFESAGGTRIYNGSSSAKLPPPPPEYSHMTPQQWARFRSTL